MQEVQQTKDALDFLLHGLLQRSSQWVDAVWYGADGSQNLVGPVMPQDLRGQYGLQHLNPQIELDVQMLETVLAAEILGHYRSYQILATIGAIPDSVDPLARALKESMQQEIERIFRLLNLLHPHLDLHSAYVGLQSTSVAVHD